MERKGVRQRLPRARRRANEHASNKVAAAQSGAISLQRLVQMRGPQWHASAVLARQLTQAKEPPRHFLGGPGPPLPPRAVGSIHKPEPSAPLLHYFAICRAKRGRSPNHKLRMLLSAQRQTHESP